MDSARDKSRRSERRLLIAAIGLGVLNIFVAVMLFAPGSNADARGSLIAPPPVSAMARTDSLTQLQTRPLFSASRRAAEQPTNIANARRNAPVLKGVSISMNRKSAVFAGVEGPLVMREGESRDGVSVVSINETEVVLDTARGRVRLRIDE